MKIRWQLSSIPSPNLAIPRAPPSPTYKVLRRDQRTRVGTDSGHRSGHQDDLLYLLSLDLRRLRSRPPPYDLRERLSIPAPSPPALPQCAPTPPVFAPATNPAVVLAPLRRVCLAPPPCQSSPPRSPSPPAPPSRRTPPSRTLTSTLSPNLRSPTLKSLGCATPPGCPAWVAPCPTCQCSLPPRESYTAPPRNLHLLFLHKVNKVILSTNPLLTPAPAASA